MMLSRPGLKSGNRFMSFGIWPLFGLVPYISTESRQARVSGKHNGHLELWHKKHAIPLHAPEVVNDKASGLMRTTSPC